MKKAPHCETLCAALVSCLLHTHHHHHNYSHTLTHTHTYTTLPIPSTLSYSFIWLYSLFNAPRRKHIKNMDNSDDGQPFPDNAPFRHPTVIAHLSLMTISFLACYPLALIQGARRHRRYHLYTLAGGILVALVGYVAAWSSSFSSQQPLHTVLSILGYILFVLVLGHIGLTVYNFYYGGEKQQQLVNSNKETWWMRFILPLEESVHLVIGWIVVLTGYAYLVIAIIVFTGTCSSSIEQCLMPLAIGSGFLGYGTLVLLHLVNVLNLPRGSTPEYYEALVLTLWGVVCLVISGM